MEIGANFEIISIAILLAILLVDLIITLRHPKAPSNRSSLAHIFVYSGLAIIFGIIIWNTFSSELAIQFYSGWLTEYSLSIDNLFVFIMIIASFKVPKELQKVALGIGVIIALVLRGIFILLGGAIISSFQWVFYIFGIFLLWTAINLLVKQESSDEWQEGRIISFIRKFIKISDQYDGVKIRTIATDGKYKGLKVWTPIVMVFISLGITDLFFAFDSIPAIFGLTTNSFIVFTANIFALMGLQQLYFLLGNAVDKLKFLPLGIAIILAFIGVKLIFEAMHSTGIAWAPEIGTIPSLTLIVITILFTTLASLVKSNHDNYVASLRRVNSNDELKGV